MQKGSRSPFYRVARKIKNERRAAIARATMASSASTSDTCDWHPKHGADDKPQGARCGAAATHRILWLDGSKRYSLACGAHLELDKIAPRRKIESLTSPRSAATSEVCSRCGRSKPIGELNMEAMIHHRARTLACKDRKQCERTKRKAARKRAGA